MQVIYARCAGLDVHKKSVVACVLWTREDGSVQEQVRTFGTMTADLAALSQWLRTQQVEQVALESTGVFWWPVFNLLDEDGHAVMLVNPQHIKAVPGRKTDVRDSKWLADLLRHGLLAPSFIPPAAIRELRELTRYRKALVRERTQEVNRLQKVLEAANIKLAAVATDILGGCRYPGRSGAGPVAQEAGAACPGSGGAREAAPPCPHPHDSAACELPRAVHRGRGCRGGRCAGPFRHRNGAPPDHPGHQ